MNDHRTKAGYEPIRLSPVISFEKRSLNIAGFVSAAIEWICGYSKNIFLRFEAQNDIPRAGFPCAGRKHSLF